jgi:hypothetical protein
MTCRQPQPLFWSFTLAAVTALIPITARASDPPPATLTLEQIYRGASAAHKRIKNVRVEYTMVIRQLQPLPSAKTPLGQAAFGTFRVRFAYDGDRRFMNLRTDGGSKANQPGTAVFDGENSYMYESGRLSFYPGTKEQGCEAMEFYCTEMLDLAITDHQKASLDDSWQYPHTLRPRPFQTHKVLPQQEVVDGAWCHVIEQPGIHKLWVDPQLGFALRKKEMYQVAMRGREIVPGKKLHLADYSYSKHVEVEPGLWLPKRCERTTYARGSDPEAFWNQQDTLTTITVHELVVNQVTDEDFDLELPPGTWVTTPKAHFQLPGDKTTLLNSLAPTMAPPPWYSYLSPWRIGLLLSALILAGVAVALVRAWRARKAAPPPVSP